MRAAGEPSPPAHQGHADPLTDLSRELPGQHLTRPADRWLLSPSGSLQVVHSPLTSTWGHPSPFTSAPHGLAQLRSPQLGPRMLRGSTMTPGHWTSGSSSLPTLTHTCSHTLTQTHSHRAIHILTHALTHILMQTHSDTHAHTLTHTCSHTYTLMQTLTHTCSHSYTRAHEGAHMFTYTLPHMHTQTYSHAHTHVHMHTRRHT